MSTLADVATSHEATALGALACSGADTAKFLQGQLSADVEKLAPGASTLAGLHNPQGRVIALLGLVRASPEQFFAVLPLELVEAVALRLRKFVLRAKVRIEVPGPSLQVLRAPSAVAAPELPAVAWGDRVLLLVPGEHELRRAPASDLAAWELADVRAGMPQVYAATSEQFVAQMLNLDVLGAIAFDKGCYTGQEVIARAHYRGRVKRRLQRWLNTGDAQLKPGDSARGPDGRTLAVVRVARAQAGQELLAVGSFDPATGPAESSAAADAAVTVAGPLPLPYALPQ